MNELKDILCNRYLSQKASELAIPCYFNIIKNRNVLSHCWVCNVVHIIVCPKSVTLQSLVGTANHLLVRNISTRYFFIKTCVNLKCNAKMALHPQSQFHEPLALPDQVCFKSSQNKQALPSRKSQTSCHEVLVSLCIT